MKVKKEADTKAVPTKASKQSGKDIKAEPGTSAKSQGKSAKGSKKSDGSKTADVAVKREKKKFENPGQTRETPDEVRLSLVKSSILHSEWTQKQS